MQDPSEHRPDTGDLNASEEAYDLADLDVCPTYEERRQARTTGKNREIWQMRDTITERMREDKNDPLVRDTGILVLGAYKKLQSVYPAGHPALEAPLSMIPLALELGVLHPNDIVTQCTDEFDKTHEVSP